MSLSLFVQSFAERPFTARDAAAALGLRRASSALSRLVREGALERLGRGVYRVSKRPRTGELAARLAEVEQQRQAELFPALAGEVSLAWRTSGRFVRLRSKRYRLTPMRGTTNVRRLA